MKQCFKCQRELPIDEFYVHPRMADGHLGKCKECTKKDARAYARTHRADCNERQKNWHQRHRVEMRDKLAHWRSAHRERSRSYCQVHRAIGTGKVSRPAACQECGATVRLHAHHSDYTKPLDVRFLCPLCHKIAHGMESRV